MTAGAWSEAIDRMLSRVQDTAARVKDRFPHWADPDTGQWTTTPDDSYPGRRLARGGILTSIPTR